MSDRETEILIIGGGAAGLQAAMTPARVHRRVLLVDSGDYRNAPAEHMHNIIGFDGMAPEQFRAEALEQLASYDTVELVEDVVESIVPVAGSDAPLFDAYLRSGASVRTQVVILATGVRDELPPITGIEQLWGTAVAQCPFCHGHEFSGKTIALLGPDAAVHLAAMLERRARFHCL